MKCIWTVSQHNMMILLVLFSCLVTQNALAAAPMAKKQAPGYYRMMLGKFEVTALHDGTVGLSAKHYKGATPDEIRALLEKAFIKGDKIPLWPTRVALRGRLTILGGTTDGRSSRRP
ncbi:MAG: hypothetical protein JW818_22370, partial [Pirellulales bacterium]|nr:hypothetical protein [Pirellulales bacterium]